eukprot:TRINITY_DN387_c2_g1_i1.p1 TRINITY_DN387_c2_g1~~TRINITY_DN387_c2_g1_i1.p1  ORF type:complete len:146 (+),score=7.28 TRINITY_DN387_c2_g1_i1:207-644(+)
MAQYGNPQPAYGQPPQASYQPQGYDQPIYNPPPQPQYATQQAYPVDGYPAKPYNATPLLAEQGQYGAMPDGTCYLICSFLACFFCCWPLGIVAIIFAARTHDLAHHGDADGAWRAARATRVWIIVTIVAGCAFAVLFTILRFVVW